MHYRVLLRLKFRFAIRYCPTVAQVLITVKKAIIVFASSGITMVIVTAITPFYYNLTSTNVGSSATYRTKGYNRNKNTNKTNNTITQSSTKFNKFRHN